MRKFLFVLTGHASLGTTGQSTGYYLSEVSHPYYAVAATGVEIEFASIKGGVVPMDPGSYDLTDSTNRKFIDDKILLSKLSRTTPLNQINADDYAGVFFPGGHGTVFDLPKSDALAELVANIFENDGIVAAVCHGPSALLNVKLRNGEHLVKGKHINSFTDDEEREVKLDKVVPFLLETELKKRGALFEKADIQKEKVVVDGKLVTGQNPESALGVGIAIAKLINA